jgi:hypothetical protein
MRRGTLRTIIPLLVVLMLWSTGAAFAQLSTGNLYGEVIDEPGEALPGVIVTLTGIGTPSLVQVTNANGQFRFESLPPGNYLLTMELDGFTTVEYPNVVISVNKNTSITAILIPAENPICHQLTLDHTEFGSDPVATPVNSAGCSSGKYHFEQPINLTANPDDGWEVGSWTGTSNDSSTSTSNSLTMPNTNHTITVNYISPPGTPTNVSATDGTYTDKVRITWDDVTGEDSYDLYRCLTTSTDSCSLINSPMTNSTSYDDNGASADGTVYYYRIRACSIANGCSGISDPDSGNRARAELIFFDGFEG